MHYLRVNKTILQICGIWFDENLDTIGKKLLFVGNVLRMFYSIVFFPLQLVEIFIGKKNMYDTIKNVTVVLGYTLEGVKTLIWYKRKARILSNFKELSRNTPTFLNESEINVGEIIRKERNEKDRIIISYFTLANLIPLAAFFGTIYNMLWKSDYYKLIVVTGNETVWKYTQKMPYYAYIPFDINSSVKRYFYGLVFVWLPIYQSAIMIVASDSLLLGILSYGGAHLNVLAKAVETLIIRCQQNPSALRREMEICVNHSKNILKYCQEIENIFQFWLLLQFVFSLLFIALSLFLVTQLSGDKSLIISEVMFLMACEFQILMYSYYGHKIFNGFQKLKPAIYNTDWHDTSKVFKKDMVLFMMAFSRQINIRIGKLYALNLTAFVEIGRQAYAYFAVLKNLSIKSNEGTPLQME